jgi:hypothetical protein
VCESLRRLLAGLKGNKAVSAESEPPKKDPKTAAVAGTKKTVAAAAAVTDEPRPWQVRMQVHICIREDVTYLLSLPGVSPSLPVLPDCFRWPPPFRHMTRAVRGSALNWRNAWVRFISSEK